MRHTCQARNHHAEGYSASEADKRELGSRVTGVVVPGRLLSFFFGFHPIPWFIWRRCATQLRGVWRSCICSGRFLGRVGSRGSCVRWSRSNGVFGEHMWLGGEERAVLCFVGLLPCISFVWMMFNSPLSIP